MQGKAPEPRFDHSMCRLRENLVVLGGRSRMEFTKSIYLLDLCKLVWTRLAHKTNDEDIATSQMGLERAEFACGASRQEDKIFIFGGIDSTFVLTNEVKILEFD